LGLDFHSALTGNVTRPLAQLSVVMQCQQVRHYTIST